MTTERLFQEHGRQCAQTYAQRSHPSDGEQGREQDGGDGMAQQIGPQEIAGPHPGTREEQREPCEGHRASSAAIGQATSEEHAEGKSECRNGNGRERCAMAQPNVGNQPTSNDQHRQPHDATERDGNGSRQ